MILLIIIICTTHCFYFNSACPKLNVNVNVTIVAIVWYKWYTRTRINHGTSRTLVAGLIMVQVEHSYQD